MQPEQSDLRNNLCAFLETLPVLPGFTDALGSTSLDALRSLLERVTLAHSATAQHAAYNGLLATIAVSVTGARGVYEDDALYDEIRVALNPVVTQFRRAATEADFGAAYVALQQALLGLVRQTLPGYTPTDRALFDLALQHGHHEFLALPVEGSSRPRETECVAFSRTDLLAFVAELQKRSAPGSIAPATHAPSGLVP